MQLRTYTRVLTVERRIYNWYDKKLPINPTWTQIGVFVAVGVPLWLALRLLGVGLTGGGAVLWVAPPAWAAWAISAVRVEAKSLIAWCRSQVRYLGEAKLYHRLARAGVARSVRATVEVWGPAHSQPPPAPDQPAMRRALGLRPPRSASTAAAS